jgi:transglutaminase-like putative cysteine protease
MNSTVTQTSRLEQITLAVFTCASLASFAFSQKAQFEWVFLLPCGVALFWRIQRLPPFAVPWIRYAAWAILAATVFVGLIHRAYPILPDETVKRPLMLAGFTLSFFAVLFLLGTRFWSPAKTLFPVTVGIFLIAAFNPAAPHLHELLIFAGAAAFTYLWTHGRTSSKSGDGALAGRTQFVRLGISGALVFLIAWGIISILPWLQVRIMESTNRLALPHIDFYPGLSQVSRLGDLEELQLSQKVVMRLWTARPQKLRGRVFTQFDGKAWHAIAKGGRNLMPVPANTSAGLTATNPSSGTANLAQWLDSVPGNTFALPRDDVQTDVSPQEVRTRIIQTVFNGGMLVSPGNKLMVRLAAPYVYEDIFENLSQPSGSASEIYGLVNLPEGGVAQIGPGPEELLNSCLALPDDTDPRLKELAQKLKVDTKSPEERIQKTLTYLGSQCQYSLKVGKFHSTQPVAEFIFEKKRGYCEYFASAAAVLLRLEDVPSRYVTGFNVQDGNHQGSHYVVREADAHAWIEAYFPGKGWMEIDPTPESEYAALHSGLHDGWGAAAMEWVATVYAEISARVGQGNWLLTLQWIRDQIIALVASLFLGWRNLSLLVLALALAWTIRFVRRRKTLSPSLARRLPSQESSSTPSELIDLMRRLDTIWSRAGFGRPASRAPLEHLTAIPEERISTALRDSGRQIIECFYRTSFGGFAFTLTEARELSLKLDQAEKTRPD